MSNILIYSTGTCPYCKMAQQRLRERGATQIEEIRIDLEPKYREEMLTRTGRRTVPQIYIGDFHVGGYDDLVALDQAGKLVPMINS